MAFYFRPAKQIYLFFLTTVLLTACRHPKDADVSNIDVKVTIERFDKDLDAMRTHNREQVADQLIKKYGPFYRDFIERIIQVGSLRDTGYLSTLGEVLHNQPYNDVEHEVDSVYPNLDKQNEQLTDAFKHIKYYFPKKALPKVYAYISGFAIQTPLGDGYVAVSLDMFLGANSKFYNAAAIREVSPKYVSRRFAPEYIVPRVVETMAKEDMFPETPQDDKTMLSRMVYAGKILYFMDKVMPNIPDTLKIGYTGKQLKWCQDFKPEIWGYFLEQNLLFETDYDKYQKYVGEAPFTPGFGENNDSAPRLAVWTGWQIVKEYMAKHPEITLQQLMADKDWQKIFNQSRYRPKDK
ncbi:MAG TPA: gliding motility lipoprotein GldB [Mucilaginibacter sp.]|jgi:gliding motility-associated lipoprotein GldB|nr:gliding motility lipoprotein GldB [Mucilaginibacter sp.]